MTYGSLLQERRRALHTSIVEAIERLDANRLDAHVERLAHHASRGEVWDKAPRYLRQAGVKVYLRAANREAAACFEQALDALRRLPDHPDAIAESLELRFELRNAILTLGEWNRLGVLLDETEALADAVGDSRRLGQTLNYKVIHYWMAADHASAIQAGLRGLAIGESQEDVALQVVGNNCLGLAYLARGECHAAVRHCEVALSLLPGDALPERFGQATIQTAFVRSTLAQTLVAVGRFAEALEHVHEAMQIAEEAGHVFSLLFPLISRGYIKLDQGDFDGAVAPLERGVELCRTREAPMVLLDFTWALGVAYFWTGRRGEGIGLMEEAARGFAERNQRWSLWPGRVASLGHAYLLDGRPKDATRIAEHGLAEARHRGEAGKESHVLRLLGDIATDPDTAEAHYRQALGTADEMGLRPLGAHCHLGLGKLYSRTGQRERAREHITTATMMYREMDMRFWLEQAQAEQRGA